MYRTNSYSLGISVKVMQALRNKTTAFFDSLREYPTGSGSDPDITSIETEVPAFDELNPTLVRTGFACFPSRDLTLSFDLLYHQGVLTPYPVDGGTDLLDTLNYSAGLEWGKKLILRTGFFTNNSMYPALSADQKNQPPHIDFFGLTFGLGLKDRQAETSVGVAVQTASGEAQILSDSFLIQKVEGVLSMAVWSASYNL
jgi:hypothetical protein